MYAYYSFVLIFSCADCEMLIYEKDEEFSFCVDCEISKKIIANADGIFFPLAFIPSTLSNATRLSNKKWAKKANFNYEIFCQWF